MAIAITAAMLAAALAALEKKRGYPTTEFTRAIFQFLATGTGNGMADATAGSGKTSAIEDGIFVINHIYGKIGQLPLILGLAFNKAIAMELQARINAPNFKGSTFNSLGAGILFKNMKTKAILDEAKTEIIAKGIMNYDRMSANEEKRFWVVFPAMRRLVDLFRAYGLGAHHPMPTESDIYEMTNRYNLDLPDADDMAPTEFNEWVFKIYDACINNLTMIDFNDQLFMPIRHNMPFPTYYKFIFVDETQDLNVIQTEMVRRLAARGARVLFVGDPFQSIYGFRGSDLEVINRLRAEFSTTELPLWVSWRCPKVVVERAQEFGSPIQAAPNAIEGKEETLKNDHMIERAQSGDFILCRTCAPVVETALELIRNGKKAYVQGSDMIKGLINLLNKIGKKGYNGNAAEQISTYVEQVMMKIKDDKKREKMSDKLMTLAVLAEEIETLDGVARKIENLFKDDQKGIMCSTVHRAKGLESANVFIIHPELMPHPMAKLAWERQQEVNLQFVAVTRAKENLYWVENKVKESA